MKRIDFTITGGKGASLREPCFVQDCAELPQAIMQAVQDFLEVHGGEQALPITILARSADTESC
jgi:hypothetical protein